MKTALDIFGLGRQPGPASMKHATLSRLTGSAASLLTAISLCMPTVWAQDASPTHPYGQSLAIPGSYIVVFKDHVTNPAAEAENLMQGRGGSLLRTYSSALKGFAARLPDSAISALLVNPNVAFIEQDQTVSLHQITSTQNYATWGLDRIDQRALPLDTTYHFNQTGAGVNAFIIDTGILANHDEFGNRLSLSGFDAINDGKGTNDCNGHGTHVAGTVAGKTWGVAKAASLIPVRVLNCSGSGSYSGVIAGVDWVANSSLRPAVANMSLGGGTSSAMDAAVAGATAKGVTMVVAAGNSNTNACTTSPARAPSAITVGASTSADARASYSNYGSCVDLFAPGSSITSAWNTSTSASNTISGTSMASPHVAGVAALVLAANPLASPAAIANFLTGNATSSLLSSIGTGSPNLLVYSMATGEPKEPVLQSVAVKIYGSASLTGSKWRAHANVSLIDAEGSPQVAIAVAGASVSGNFVPGGGASCLTTKDGTCTLTSGPLTKNVPFTKFTVIDVSGSNLSYNASKNQITEIIIYRP